MHGRGRRRTWIVSSVGAAGIAGGPDGFLVAALAAAGAVVGGRLTPGRPSRAG